MKLRVVSFNLRTSTWLDGWHAWPLRKQAALHGLRLADADIIGCQEALDPMHRYVERGLDGYASSGEGRNGGRRGEMCPIYVRRDKWSIREQGTSWLSERPKEPGSIGWDARCPRICTWVQVQGGTSALRIYNTHLDHVGRTARLESVRLIAALIEEHNRSQPLPYVLMGDWNDTPDSEPIRELLRLLPLQGDMKLGATWWGFHRNRPQNEAQIDYILASPQLRVEHTRLLPSHVLGRRVSDHAPVLAQLSLPTI